MILQIPAELTLRILCHLDLPDLLSASLTNSTLNNYVQTFQVLQYRFLSHAARIEDTPHTDVVVGERFERLKRREDGWARLNVDFSRSLPVHFDISGIYELMGGIYLLGDSNRRKLHYCRLPSTPSDPLSWSFIDARCMYIDVGMNIYEHDLIAIVTSQLHPTNGAFHEILVQFVEFSTGRPHPRAHNPILPVAVTLTAHPSVGIEIVGNRLAVIIHHQRPTHPDDTICVYDWQSGHLLLMLPHHGYAYASLTFLSPTLLLLPRTASGVLDIWEIPSDNSAPPTTPRYALSLPRLSPSHFCISLSCRGENNPTAPQPGAPKAQHAHHQPPFRTTANDSIVLLQMRTVKLEGDGWVSDEFSIFVTRGALLEVCQKWSAAESAGDDGVVALRWDQWGPGITRWIDASKTQTRWITTSAGTRCVLTKSLGNDDFEDAAVREIDEGDNAPPPLRVLDFNSIVLRKLAGGNYVIDRSAVDIEVVTEPSTLVSEVFEEPVVSELPYVSFTPRNSTRFEGFESVLMDEDRLIGLRVDADTQNVVGIEVMHIGTSASGE
ncbi:hypothetical protein DXG03_004807 [Asterophora parasitica]|uniref:F-box domain-containing protein n=1 Tax=Asterophora parasitica TaxID=117018 RepID=A0A9P7G6R8_9AGAR|nr:hypothetical protein DXG03_004807 [Asterophora parasitica]